MKPGMSDAAPDNIFLLFCELMYLCMYGDMYVDCKLTLKRVATQFISSWCQQKQPLNWPFKIVRISLFE